MSRSMPVTCLARPAFAPLCPPIVSIAATASIGGRTSPPPVGNPASESRAPDTSAAVRLPAASRASSRSRSSDAVAKAWRCIVPRSVLLASASSFSNMRRATGRSPASVPAAPSARRQPATRRRAPLQTPSPPRAGVRGRSQPLRRRREGSRSARARRAMRPCPSVGARRRSPEGGACRPIASAPRSTPRSRPQAGPPLPGGGCGPSRDPRMRSHAARPAPSTHRRRSVRASAVPIAVARSSATPPSSGCRSPARRSRTSFIRPSRADLEAATAFRA